MSTSIEEVEESILRMLENESNGQLPRSLVENNLSSQYSIGHVNGAITNLINKLAIDLVVDYPSDDSELDSGRPCWHLKILSIEEKQEIRDLSPMALGLLRIVQEADGVFPGETPIKEVRDRLAAKGFSNDDLDWMDIPNRIRRTKATCDGKSIHCFMLIPEYEKTEEYKRTMEEMHEEFSRKEDFRMYIADIHDLAHGILEAVRASPEGISKKDIIKQLFMDEPDYLKDAFRIATEENEILPVVLDGGEEGYRLNPTFHEEDF